MSDALRKLIAEAIERHHADPTAEETAEFVEAIKADERGDDDGVNYENDPFVRGLRRTCGLPVDDDEIPAELEADPSFVAFRNGLRHNR